MLWKTLVLGSGGLATLGSAGALMAQGGVLDPKGTFISVSYLIGIVAFTATASFTVGAIFKGITKDNEERQKNITDLIERVEAIEDHLGFGERDKKRPARRR